MVCWHTKPTSHVFTPVVDARGAYAEPAVCHATETCFIPNPDRLYATTRLEATITITGCGRDGG